MLNYTIHSEQYNWTGEHMTEHVFESVKALADKLNISRTTLYKRAKDNRIELTGTYTQGQLDKLMGVQLKADAEHGNEQKPEQPVNNAIQALVEQLTVKDEQIAELNRRLEQTQKLVDQSQQLQLKTQLQLEAEQQKLLTLENELNDNQISDNSDEMNKALTHGFWSRLFGSK